jgi:hypothetical protein
MYYFLNELSPERAKRKLDKITQLANIAKEPFALCLRARANITAKSWTK